MIDEVGAYIIIMKTVCFLNSNLECPIAYICVNSIGVQCRPTRKTYRIPAKPDKHNKAYGDSNFGQIGTHRLNNSER